jgi:hypothetical protein
VVTHFFDQFLYTCENSLSFVYYLCCVFQKEWDPASDLSPSGTVR